MLRAVKGECSTLAYSWIDTVPCNLCTIQMWLLACYTFMGKHIYLCFISIYHQTCIDSTYMLLYLDRSIFSFQTMFIGYCCVCAYTDYVGFYA